ncbi:MAG: hypothetical protein ACRDTZ_10960 [Pseudonocardiaceae bacterium]
MFTNAGATTASNATWLVDIGVGGAGSEQVLVPNFRLAATTFETFVPSVMPTVPVSIPQSSRLAVRAQCSITTNSIGGRLFDVVLYGIT